MRSEEVSLVSNWWNLVCSSSVPDFLARNRYFLARNGHFLARKYTEQRREQKIREQYSRADQSREEKSRYYSREQQSRTKLRMENN